VQHLLHVALPAVRGSLVAALALGFGRAVGDTVIALMVSGNAPRVPESPSEPLRALTAHIALVLSTDSQGAAYASLFASGMLLCLVAVLVNLVVARMKDART
jgi:phosphate transport system permease protein